MNKVLNRVQLFYVKCYFYHKTRQSFCLKMIFHLHMLVFQPFGFNIYSGILHIFLLLKLCFHLQAEIARHMIGDREWEVYRVLLDEGDSSSIPRNKIEEAVRKMLMGWE